MPRSIWARDNRVYLIRETLQSVSQTRTDTSAFLFRNGANKPFNDRVYKYVVLVSLPISRGTCYLD